MSAKYKKRAHAFKISSVWSFGDVFLSIINKWYLDFSCNLVYIFQRLQIALALLAHASLVSLKNSLVLITPNCKRNHVITYTYFHLTGLHPLHHRQLQVLPVHLVLLTMVSNDPDSTNSLWFGDHSCHSGQTSSMRKGINLARPLANFPRKIFKENQRSILQML